MRQETKIKEMQMGKEEVKLFLFANMILYILRCHTKTQDLTNKFNKLTR